MFRLLIVLILGLTLSLGWMHKKGEIPQTIRTVEALLRPVFHKDTIYYYAEIYNEDPLLILALIKAESHFFKKAKSSRGAVGLMQLMPATAKEMAKDLNIKDLKAESLEDAKTNIRIGTYYLARLHKEFENDTLTTLAAYNAGRKNVKVWLKNRQKKSLSIEDIEFPETRKFVKDVLSTHKQLMKLKDWRIKVMRRFVKSK